MIFSDAYPIQYDTKYFHSRHDTFDLIMIPMSTLFLPSGLRSEYSSGQYILHELSVFGKHMM